MISASALATRLSRQSPCMRSRAFDFRGSSPQRAIECSHVLRERLGLLHCGEMAALLHDRPTTNVGEHDLGQRTRGSQDFAREFGVSSRRRNRRAIRDHPGSMPAKVIGIERRSDGAREPIEADVGQYLVTREDALDIAAAVGPSAEFLDDPRREPRRRIAEAEAQGLRARALNPLIAGLLIQPMGELIEKDALLGGRIFYPVRLAADGKQIDMNADQLI